MVRKETAMSMRLLSQYQGLDVMRSPVSLCTGVMYDRASIQWWLDSGNTTCPAIMLPLPSTDLVPNLTLRSLIAHWSTSAASCSPDTGSATSAAGPSPTWLVRQVASSDADPSTALLELVAYLSNEDTNKKRVATGLAVDAAASAASLAHVLRGGSGLEVRIDAARLVEFLLANAADEATAAVAESFKLVAELIRLIGPVDKKGSLGGQGKAGGGGGTRSRRGGGSNRAGGVGNRRPERKSRSSQGVAERGSASGWAQHRPRGEERRRQGWERER